MLKPTLSLLIWPLIGVSLLLLGIGVSYWKLRITTIECQIQSNLQTSPCREELTLVLQPLIGRSLVGSNLMSTISTIISDQRLPYELQTIHKTLAGTLTVVVIQDPFVYQLVDEATQTKWLVTDHGWLRSTESSNSAQPELPLINRRAAATITAGDENPSQRLANETHAFIMHLLPALTVYGVDYQSITLYDRVTTIITLKTKQHILIENDQLLTNLERWKLIASHPSRISPTPPIVEYDVRFNLPVLRAQTSISGL